MSNDTDIKRNMMQARREYPETQRALDKYRAVLMDNWLKSHVSAAADREGIYQQIKAMEKVEAYLKEAMAMGQEELDAYAKQFATTGNQAE